MHFHPIKTVLIIAYVCAGAMAGAYLAAVLYFLVNKTMPTGIALDTWYRYWIVYGANTVQQPRLVGSAITALALVYGVPLALLASALGGGRSLHGDARWATDSEIRKAGLL